MENILRDLASHPNNVAQGSRYSCPDCGAWGCINGNLGQLLHGGESVVWELEGKQIYVCPKRKPNQISE